MSAESKDTDNSHKDEPESSEPDKSYSRMIFIGGLILCLVFPIAGIPLLLWVGFGNLTSSKATRSIARIVGITTGVVTLLFLGLLLWLGFALRGM